MNAKLTFSFILIGCLAFAQDDEKAKQKALTQSKDLTWEANKELSENDFIAAEMDYRRAIAKSDENAAARYNLGNAYYNNGTFSEAFGRFKEAGETSTDKAEKHLAYHNMGNVFMKRKEYEKAVEAYKEALRNDPTDEETRYNLALAKEMLEKEQQNKDKNEDKEDKEDNEDKKDEKDKDEDEKEGENEEEKKDDKKEDGDKGDEGDEEEEKKDENKEGEGDEKKEQEKKPDKGDQQEQEQPQQRRPDQLSKQQVQNLLEAMQNEEKKVQDKIDAQKVKGVKTKNEKDW
ncbi:MAG: tetratricopeptide repeat protein [Pricia sp.]